MKNVKTSARHELRNHFFLSSTFTSAVILIVHDVFPYTGRATIYSFALISAFFGPTTSLKIRP